MHEDVRMQSESDLSNFGTGFMKLRTILPPSSFLFGLPSSGHAVGLHSDRGSEGLLSDAGGVD